MKKFPGIYKAVKKDGTIYYRASITYLNKHISLGSFNDEITAHMAYVEAREILTDFDIEIENYDRMSLTTVLKFNKWVCLINFRDNRIYFKTSIYLKKKYFLYYLSYEHVLKFDIDDLFYYADKTIMKRKGHMFVADYGMQVNILSRYGIKNYSRVEKDYYFVNKDMLDFRYENIVIINKYNGVSKMHKNGKNIFCTKIHINGNFIVGYYDMEEYAAIAYNKAVDIALKMGIKKKFMQNYITEITSKEYAYIYIKLEISDKFINYLKTIYNH